MHFAELRPEHSAYRPVMQAAYSRGMAYDSPRQVRRRENLRRLVEENGGQAQVAREVDTPKSHLSAILAGRRGVGDELADKLERHFDKPPGWMDSEDADALLPAVSEVAAAINALPPTQREWVLKIAKDTLGALAEALNPPKANGVTIDERQSPEQRKRVG